MDCETLPADICENTFRFDGRFDEISLSQQNPTWMGQPYGLSTFTDSLEKTLAPPGRALSNSCEASSRSEVGGSGNTCLWGVL